jgi:hypothetical protein
MEAARKCICQFDTKDNITAVCSEVENYYTDSEQKNSYLLAKEMTRYVLYLH